jgi:hypothetical protein
MVALVLQIDRDDGKLRRRRWLNNVGCCLGPVICQVTCMMGPPAGILPVSTRSVSFEMDGVVRPRSGTTLEGD